MAAWSPVLSEQGLVTMYQSYATAIGLAESLYQGHLIVLPHICRHREEDPPIKDNFHICNLQKRTLPPPSHRHLNCNLHFTFSHYFATSKRGQPPPPLPRKIFTFKRGQPDNFHLHKRTTSLPSSTKDNFHL